MCFSKKILFVIIFLILTAARTSSQNLTNDRVKNFLDILTNNKDGLESFVLPVELSLSKRLGIEYSDVKYKFLIGNDVSKEIKKSVIDDKIQYNFEIENLGDVYSKVTFKIPELNYIKSFYFSGEYLISQIYYFTHNWKKSEGKYFIVYYSDPLMFNDYSLQKLDGFLDSNFSTLNLSNIEQNKIYYYLCKNQDEIEQLTGYKTLGLSNLAYDYVISTFNCHYHETSHIIMNAELKNIPLYTHPFLQEGFAVAMGGRGGREPYIILESGDFITKSGFMDYAELLDRNKFLATDASMSYALSGLYNYFLIHNYYNEYYKLYLKYSSSESGINNLIIDSTDLPKRNIWVDFLLKSKFLFKTVILESNDHQGEIVLQNENCKIFYDELHGLYSFRLKDTLLLSAKEFPANYESKKFKEIFPDRKYNGEKYLIIVNKKELQIYNLFTNNLIANYVSSFELPPQEISESEGRFYFIVKSRIFDEDIKQLIISN